MSDCFVDENVNEEVARVIRRLEHREEIVEAVGEIGELDSAQIVVDVDEENGDLNGQS